MIEILFSFFFSGHPKKLKQWQIKNKNMAKKGEL